MAAFDSTLIARLATGLYNVQVGNALMQEALDSVNGNAYGSVAALADALYSRDFGAWSNADVAALLVDNVGITGAAEVAEATAIITGALDGTAAGSKGSTVLNLLNAFSNLNAATYSGYVSAFNTQISAAVAYAQTPGTPTVSLDAEPSTEGMVFTLVAESAAGADVMHLMGDQDVRIDFTNPANQVVGLDLDGDGTIEFNGSERSITGVAANFEIVDAYSRNPLNHTDTANNFLGDIYFDGTGFGGDGTDTDGNIFLGGLGLDTALGGIGNDFLAGGAIAQDRWEKFEDGTDSDASRDGGDQLYGGRNADFFFAEFSMLDIVDGNGHAVLYIDGGNTSDDSPAGKVQTDQDSDWLLLEGSDDDEPLLVELTEGDGQGTDQNDAEEVQSRTGQWMDIEDVENLDASGNLYGFLDDMTDGAGDQLRVGGRATDLRYADGALQGSTNYGIGSSAQMDIEGTDVANIIIAGYDNDYVDGNGGNDLIFGGNLQFLMETVAGGVTNVNLAGITLDGMDDLSGGEGDDGLMFEADGGSVDGDGGNDTLWLTNYSLGTATAGDATTDGVLRFDLEGQNDLADQDFNGEPGMAGYGGADAAGTADQTNYSGDTDNSRVDVDGMDNIDASGLSSGARGLDYYAAGSNDPDLAFTNRQNFWGYDGDLTLRGTGGENGLYAGAGSDVLEGRRGDDFLMGGAGDDDFYFAIDGDNGNDGIDIIRRKVDADGDGFWDGSSATKTAGTWGQDFGLDATVDENASFLVVDFRSTDFSDPNVLLTSFSLKIGGVVFAVTDTDSLDVADADELAEVVNAAYHELDPDVTVTAEGNTLIVTDAQGRDISDTVPEGYLVSFAFGNAGAESFAKFTEEAPTISQDRLIYKSYEDRSDNEGVDDDSVTGSTISLGEDAYAEDLVISFQADGTRIAEEQQYLLTFTNLTTEDQVTIDVNGVKYSLRVGVDLDGNSIAGEDGVGDDQGAIQAAFLARLADYITNSFTDDDTVAGKVIATAGATTITLRQQEYNGEETVFMRSPTVKIDNDSGGERATYKVTNQAQHEVLLYQFDGRDGALNEDNVLFWGQQSINRANLETAVNVGANGLLALVGTEALVIDGGSDNLAASIANGNQAAIANNTATNATAGIVGQNFTVHGDDFLIGGTGIDSIFGGTGDDRVIGSAGSATAPAIGGTDGERADGGKNFYAVQVLGEARARVYVLNKWEAQNPSQVADLNGLTLSSITPIRDNEFGTGLSGGKGVADTMFDDTLQFQQEDFGPNARFAITLDDFSVSGGVVQTKNDGAGLVAVDSNGDGTVDSYTRFTNFENIRTVSGSGNAVAGDGQGNDTLNVAAMSTATGGISYNLTNTGQAGEVRYSKDAHAFGQASAAVATAEQLRLGALRPQLADFDALVIKVDGVESVIGGEGDDLLLIDETESAKNNAFTGSLGDDRIEYQSNFGGANPLGAEPTVTIKVSTSPGVDLVEMTGGRLGLVKATDTLDSVEFITLIGNTAQSTRENDVLDVSALSGGAVVNYNDLLQSSAANGTGIAASGTVRVSNSDPRAGAIELTVENLFQVENVTAGAGADRVMVADADLMNLNTTSDATPTFKDITFATFIDFDEITTADKRVAFLSQTPAQRVDVANNGQFKFDLGAGSDVVDYSWADDNISVVVELDETKQTQFVIVDSDDATFGADLDEAGDRVDVLTGVEGIVAAQGESVLDLTASTKGLEIRYSAFDIAQRVPKTTTLDAYDVYTVRISDLSSASPLSRSFIEHRPSSENNVDDVNLADKPQAAWTRIEGSDNAETVILNAAHSQSNDAFNLRGGANVVKYNELTRSIVLDVGLANATGSGTNDGIQGRVTFTDGNNAALPNGGTHFITSYAAGNKVSPGSLRIAASQDAEDTVGFDFGATPQKLFILGKVEAGDDLITVNLEGQADSLVLTGFERLSDDPLTNDIYQMDDLLRTFNNLTLVDAGNDHDGIRVPNAAADFQFSGVVGQTTIDLTVLNSPKATPVGGFGFDFDILDITPVTLSTVTTINGVVAGVDDELVMGAIRNIANVNDFESVVLTDATINENGAIYVLDTTANTLEAGTKTITFNNDMDALSFGGTLLGAPAPVRAPTTGISAATGNVEVSVVGNEDVTLWGGSGNDVLKGAGGDDTLRGGKGNDTLDGSFVAEVQERVIVTLNGGAATLEAGDVLVIAGITIGDIGSGANIEVVAGSDADQVGDAFRVFASTAANRALIEVSLGMAAGTLGSVTYDATSNDLAFNFTSAAGDVAGGTVTVINALMVTGTLNGTVFENGAGNSLDFAARQESFDRYIFEGTAANNGSDTIQHFTPFDGLNGDTLDFVNFLPAVGVTTFANTDLTAAATFAGAEVVVIGFNKGTLGVDDFGAGKLQLSDGGKAVFITTADQDGAVDGTIEGYKVYFVRDVDATAGISYEVALVGTVSSDTELAPNTGVGGIGFAG